MFQLVIQSVLLEELLEVNEVGSALKRLESTCAGIANLPIIFDVFDHHLLFGLRHSPPGVNLLTLLLRIHVFLIGKILLVQTLLFLLGLSRLIFDLFESLEGGFQDQKPVFNTLVDKWLDLFVLIDVNLAELVLLHELLLRLR